MLKRWWWLLLIAMVLQGCGARQQAAAPRPPAETSAGQKASAGAPPSATAPHETASGIEGRTRVDAGCPVVMAGEPCPRRPVSAEIDVTSGGSSEVVARVVSGADGTFRVSLLPGRYTVTAHLDNGAPVVGQNQVRDVVVRPGAYSAVGFQFDTGIRLPRAR